MADDTESTQPIKIIDGIGGPTIVSDLGQYDEPASQSSENDQEWVTVEEESL